MSTKSIGVFIGSALLLAVAFSYSGGSPSLLAWGALAVWFYGLGYTFIAERNLTKDETTD